MTQTNEEMTFTAKGQPNPYNQRKEWHNETQVAGNTADSLFVPPASAPSKQVTDDDHDWKKRFGDLQTHYDGTKAELTKTQEALQKMEERFAALEAGNIQSGDNSNQPPVTQKEEQTEPKSDDKVDPTVAALQEQLSKLTQESEKGKKEKAQAEIRKAHSDFDELKNSNEFHEWAKTKSETIQRAIYQNPYDYVAAIEALDLYKFESAKAAQAKQAEEQAARTREDASSIISTPNSAGADEGNQPKVWRTSEINRITKNPNLLMQYIDEINQAQREGRILKDT